MKIVYGLLFSSVLFLNLFGFYFGFFHTQWQIKKEVRKAIKHADQTQLERFEFTEAEFENIKVGKDEIRLKNNLYDIKLKESKNGWVTVWVKHDKEESELLSFFLGYFTEDDPPNDNTNVLAKLLQQEMCSYRLWVFICMPQAALSFSSSPHSYTSFFSIPPTPPPDFPIS